jgi:hypothetical protein
MSLRLATPAAAQIGCAELVQADRAHFIRVLHQDLHIRSETMEPASGA